MNNKDAMEWFQFADDDFDSANLLNEAVRKHYGIICYHCAQAAEKYLKGFLIYHDIIPPKTHNLLFLNNLCFEKDNVFEKIKPLCDFLNNFANNIRYPHQYEIAESDVNFSIAAVEKIRNIEPIIYLRNRC
jgi:HEPN domain-containing protein